MLNSKRAAKMLRIIRIYKVATTILSQEHPISTKKAGFSRPSQSIINIYWTLKIASSNAGFTSMVAISNLKLIIPLFIKIECGNLIPFTSL